MARLDFFSKIENKYNIALKRNRGIIIRLDARNTTKNRNLNLLDEQSGFTYAFKKASLEFSKKYPFIMIYTAVDEVNFFIADSKRLFEQMKSNYAQEVTAVISQEFSYLFHKNYDSFVRFAGRSFSVYKDNFNSYLIYRKHTNVCVLTTYFLKHYGFYTNKKTYIEMNEIGMKIEEYKNRTSYQKEGSIFYKGMIFEVEDVLNKGMDNLITPQTAIIDNEI